MVKNPKYINLGKSSNATGISSTQKYTHSVFLPQQAQREMDSLLIDLVQLVRLVMIASENSSHSCLFCHIQVVLSYIKSHHKELSKAVESNIVPLTQPGGLSMKSEELLAHCLAIRGESGAKGFSEGQGVVWQHAAHVTCQQKQPVAQTCTRHGDKNGEQGQ